MFVFLQVSIDPGCHGCCYLRVKAKVTIVDWVWVGRQTGKDACPVHVSSIITFRPNKSVYPFLLHEVNAIRLSGNLFHFTWPPCIIIDDCHIIPNWKIETVYYYVTLYNFQLLYTVHGKIALQIIICLQNQSTMGACKLFQLYSTIYYFLNFSNFTGLCPKTENTYPWCYQLGNNGLPQMWWSTLGDSHSRRCQMAMTWQGYHSRLRHDL